MIGVALWLLTAAVPPTTSPAGVYEIHQREMGGGLELNENGHFRYALSYGAIDEAAEGDWTSDGQTVRLTSRPMPNEPTFELVRDTPAPKCVLSVAVDWGRFGWSSPPDLLVTYEGAPAELQFLEADEQGRFHPTNCAVTSVRPLVPMFDIPGQPLKVSPASGHRLSLRFVPNDLGRPAFRGEQLRIDGPNLVMERYDARIRFLPVGP